VGLERKSGEERVGLSWPHYPKPHESGSRAEMCPV
jgi:hypothetical protein